MKYIEKLDSAVTWTALKKLAAHRLVSSMYIWLGIVPIAAKMLSGIATKTPIIVFGHRFSLVTELPFSWQSFYFSALAFTLGTIVYHIGCPRIIKEFADFNDFYNTGRHNEELEGYAEEVGVFKYPIMSYNPVDDESSRRESFWIAHRAALKHSPFLRRASAVAFMIGLALITWVFVRNLYSVIYAVGYQNNS